MADKPWPLALSPRASAISLESILEAEFNTSQMRELAKWLDVKLKGNAKSGYVQQVLEVLNARLARMQDNPDVLLDGLSAEQIDFVRRTLTAQDAFAPLPRNIALRVWARQYGVEADRRLGEMIDSLRRRAMLFPTQNYFAYGYRDAYFQWLPLPEVTPVLQWDTAVATAKGAKANKEADNTEHFLQDFDAFLDAILERGIDLRPHLPFHPQAQRVYWLQGWEHDADEAERVLKSRANWAPDPTTGFTVQWLSPFTPESAGQLENQTGLPPEKCELFWTIACALQLVRRANANETHTQANVAGIEEWLALDNTAKLNRAWVAWSEQIMDAFEARLAAGSVSPKFKVVRAIGARALTPQHLAAEWCGLRRYIMRVLRGLPANTWVDWAKLRHSLFEFFPECVWSMTNRNEWWFALPNNTRLNLAQESDWQSSMGAIIEQILRSSLQWFGALDVALDEDGNLAQFRINAVGQWLIGSRNTAAPAAALPDQRNVAPIAWKDNTTLLLPPAPERAELVSFIRKVTERGREAFSYKFSVDSMEAALAQGITPEEVARQLAPFKLKLSAALSKQFEQIAKRHGRVRVYEQLTIIEFGDDFALRELSANSTLARHIVYQISPRAVVVSDEIVEEFVEELIEKGYTPGVTE